MNDGEEEKKEAKIEDFSSGVPAPTTFEPVPVNDDPEGKRKYIKKNGEHSKNWGGKRIHSGRRIITAKNKKIANALYGKSPAEDEIFASGKANPSDIPMPIEVKVDAGVLQEPLTNMYRINNGIECPKDIRKDRYSYEEWNRIMASYALLPDKIISDLDITMLRLFCESKSRYMHALTTWKNELKENVVDESPRNQIWIDKCMKIMQKETDVMESLSGDLCLSPSSRAKANVKNKSGEEESASGMSAFEKWIKE